jgi:hypothetical protein
LASTQIATTAVTVSRMSARDGAPDGSLVQPSREGVGHGVLARVAQPLADEQQHGHEPDEPAQAVERAVEAEQHDEADGAEHRGRAEEVARHGDAVA